MTNTVNAWEKESWLRIAQGWLSMIRKPNQTQADDFHDEPEAKDTGEDGSKSSH